MTHQEIEHQIAHEKGTFRSMIYAAIRGTRSVMPIPMEIPLEWADNPFLFGQWRRLSREGSPVLVAELKEPEGSRLKLHYHDEDEVVVMISGKARFTIEGQRQIVTDGYVLSIPAGVLHEAYFIKPCHFLVTWYNLGDF